MDRDLSIHSKLQPQIALTASCFQNPYIIEIMSDGPKGVARGEGGNPPTPNRKNCRKMVLFPKALFLVTNFRKKIKNKNKNE